LRKQTLKGGDKKHLGRFLRGGRPFSFPQKKNFRPPVKPETRGQHSWKPNETRGQHSWKPNETRGQHSWKPNETRNQKPRKPHKDRTTDARCSVSSRQQKTSRPKIPAVRNVTVYVLRFLGLFQVVGFTVSATSPADWQTPALDFQSRRLLNIGALLCHSAQNPENVPCPENQDPQNEPFQKKPRWCLSFRELPTILPDHEVTVCCEPLTAWRWRRRSTG